MVSSNARQAVRLAAALLPLLLVLAPIGRVAGQAVRSSTESRYSRFFFSATTNEVDGCITKWSLNMLGLTENTDQTAGLDRYAAVTGSVSRSGVNCLQPTSRSIDSSVTVSPTAGFQKFNVWYNASHMTLRGLVNVSYTCEVFGADCGWFRGGFTVDADCSVSPYASPKTTTVEYIGSTKVTTSSSFANCGISAPGLAFNPSPYISLRYGDLVLDWTQLVSIDNVAFVSYYTKTVIMDAPAHRRVLA